MVRHQAAKGKAQFKVTLTLSEFKTQRVSWHKLAKKLYKFNSKALQCITGGIKNIERSLPLERQKSLDA